MQETNPVGPHPIEPTTVPQVPEPTAPPTSGSKVVELGVEALKGSQQGSTTQLAEISAKPSAEKGNVWGIVTFFNRRFSTITEAETKQAIDIETLKGKVERSLDRAAEQARKGQVSEKKFGGAYPSNESFTASEENIQKMDQIVAQARQEVDTLKQKKGEAEKLAEAHNTFNDLPSRIDSLEKSVRSLEERHAIAKELLELEKAMVSYKPERKWSDFAATIKERKDFAAKFREQITNNPSLKNDSVVAKYESKPSWTAKDLHKLITHLHPSLTSNFERLYNGIVQIEGDRIAHLEEQVDSLVPMFSKYNEIAKDIDDLEYKMHDQTLLGRTYRFMFSDENQLKEKLEDKKSEMKQVYHAILAKGKFNPDEMQWVDSKAKLTPEYTQLKTSLRMLSKGVELLRFRERISGQMEDLISHVREYKNTKTLSGASLETKNKLIEEYKANMRKEIKALSVIATQPKVIESRKLPNNFESRSPLAKLQTLLSVSYPSLLPRTEALFKLIQEEKLETEFTQAILEEAQTPELPKEVAAEVAAPEKAPERAIEPPPHVEPAVVSEEPPAPPHVEPAVVNEEPPALPPAPPPLPVSPSAVDQIIRTTPPPAPPPPPSLVRAVSTEPPATAAIAFRPPPPPPQPPKNPLTNRNIHVEHPGQPPQAAEGKPKKTLLEELAERKALKAGTEQAALTENKVRSLKELTEGVQRGKIKMSDITVAERKNLSAFDLAGLQAMSRRSALYQSEDDVVEPEWKDE